MNPDEVRRYEDVISAAITKELGGHTADTEIFYEGIIDTNNLTDVISAALSNAGYQITHNQQEAKAQ